MQTTDTIQCSGLTPLEFAELMDQLATNHLNLQKMPVLPARLGTIEQERAYCMAWFVTSVPNATKNALKNLRADLENQNRIKEENGDMFALTLGHIQKAQDIAKWRADKAMERAAQRHHMADYISGPKQKTENGNKWADTHIYEWPPLTMPPKEGMTGIYHEPSRYIFHTPEGKSVDLGLTNPKNPRHKPVMHISPDKAVQAFLSRIDRRIPGDFATVISRIFTESISITRHKLHFEWEFRGVKHFTELPNQTSETFEQDLEKTINSLLIPTTMSFKFNKTWVILVDVMANPSMTLAVDENGKFIPDPDSSGRYLTVSRSNHATIAEYSNEESYDEEREKIFSNDPLLGYLFAADDAFHIINGDQMNEESENDIKFAIKEDKQALIKRIKYVKQAYQRANAKSLIQKSAKNTKIANGLFSLLSNLISQLNDIEEAWPLIESNFCINHTPPITKDFFNLRGKKINGDWTQPCKSSNESTLPKLAYISPCYSLHEPDARTVKQEKPIGKVVQMSVLRSGRKCITANGTIVNIPKKPTPTFSLRHDMNPRLRRTLARLVATGRLD